MRALPSLNDVEAEVARRELHRFLRLAWPVIEPGSRFVDGMHVHAICEVLEAVQAGEIRRLLINVPPRHAKSLLTSIVFPAWVWLTAPETRFLTLSYAQGLSERHSVASRRLIESAAYEELSGGRFLLSNDQNQKSRFDNDAGGGRIATSMGGTVTGEGGDIVIVDDPHKADDGSSPYRLRRTIDWFDGTLSTRLNDPNLGVFIVICQRVHEADLSGHLLDLGGWHHLCLPAEYESDHPHRWPRDPRSQEGQLLWPERFQGKTFDDLKTTLGSFGAASQLQQRPAPSGGGVILREWFLYFDLEKPLPPFDNVIQSWDLTFGGGANADYVVGQLWGSIDGHKYLIRQVRERLSFPDTIEAILDMNTWASAHLPRFRGHAILIERAANGQAVIDTLVRRGLSVIPVDPKENKYSRATAASAQIEARTVWLPGKASADGTTFDRTHTPTWVQGLIQEACSFPNATHDDQVDALSQALIRLARPAPRIRVLG